MADSTSAIPPPRDDTATLLAAGVLAYVAETLLHEAGGHGGMCLASGSQFTLLAPLFMRCSRVSPVVLAAGPGANVLAACVYYTVLCVRAPRRPLVGLLLWLSFAFNALVACGYLFVGAMTGFGDWPALFTLIAPKLAWRVPAALVAVCAYICCLSLAARLFRQLAGGGLLARARLWRRAMLAGSGAAVVACVAEIAGGRIRPMPLLLALGCTLVVGYSLTSMDAIVARDGATACDLGPVPRSPLLIGAAVIVAAVFVLVIGPGLRLG